MYSTMHQIQNRHICTPIGGATDEKGQAQERQPAAIKWNYYLYHNRHPFLSELIKKSSKQLPYLEWNTVRNKLINFHETAEFSAL